MEPDPGVVAAIGRTLQHVLYHEENRGRIPDCCQCPHSRMEHWFSGWCYTCDADCGSTACVVHPS